MGKRSKHSAEEKIAIVEQYLSGDHAMKTFAKSKGIGRTALNDWVRNYQSMGASGFDTEKNQRYPEALKLQAVEEYLSGKGSLNGLCKKFKIKSTTQLRSWILKYNGHEPSKTRTGGRKGIMARGRKTALEERINIVRDYLQSGSNYEEIAEKHEVSYQQVYQWVRKYRKGGVEQLQDRRGKRKGQGAMTEADKLRAELKLEKAKNRHLEMEVAFLKKLEEVERRRY